MNYRKPVAKIFAGKNGSTRYMLQALETQGSSLARIALHIQLFPKVAELKFVARVFYLSFSFSVSFFFLRKKKLAVYYLTGYRDIQNCNQDKNFIQEDVTSKKIDEHMSVMVEHFTN